jgi:hypothetical protein
MNKLISTRAFSIFCFIIFIGPGVTQAQEPSSHKDISKHFIVLLSSDNTRLTNNSLDYIRSNWQEEFEPMLIETLYFSMNRAVSTSYLEVLEDKTGQKYGRDMDSWYNWLWNKPAAYGPDYFKFKAGLYGLIDQRFSTYFWKRQKRSTIRLDEVIWGGVKQDGIPPLRNPKMVNAAAADYLDEEDIVFGIEINGDARAYPKRILAWHEMFVDEVGGIPVAGIYCTLCGTVILYETEHVGVNYKLGTSGFLYRSNKLMFDAGTQSLWSTLHGKPVIGPLVAENIELRYRSVVTTSWGSWKSRHPNTKVLSLNTGYRRDYGEGAAYREYFATDQLMFQVPETDTRLNNKDEILAIRLPGISDENMAISSKYLKKRPLYSNSLAGVPFTVFTDRSGAHRVYATNGIRFLEYDLFATAKDEEGRSWTLNEDAMVSDTMEKLKRIPAYNAFWFGYYAAFPKTILVH